MNPDIKTERIFGLLMPSVIWAFTSLFTDPFPGFASARDSNGATRMLARLGGVQVPDCNFFDQMYQTPISMLGLHSHRYAPFIESLVKNLQDELRQTRIILTSQDGTAAPSRHPGRRPSEIA